MSDNARNLTRKALCRLAAKAQQSAVYNGLVFKAKQAARSLDLERRLTEEKLRRRATL